MPGVRGSAGGALVLWSATLLWPGGQPPAALILATLIVTGMSGAASMLAFDLAREGNPASVGGSATGLANTGGFSMAVVTQLVAGWLLDMGVGDGIPTALLPMVGLMALALVMVVRLHARQVVVVPVTPAAGVSRVPAPVA